MFCLKHQRIELASARRNTFYKLIIIFFESFSIARELDDQGRQNVLRHACTYKTMNTFLGSILFNSGISLHRKYVQKKLQLDHISVIHHKLVMFEPCKDYVHAVFMSSFFLQLP